MPERDEHGRFVKGGGGGAAGGRARAAKLTAEERRAIARLGLQAVADKLFDGDVDAAQHWLATRGGQAHKRARAAARGAGVDHATTDD